VICCGSCGRCVDHPAAVYPLRCRCGFVTRASSGIGTRLRRFFSALRVRPRPGCGCGKTAAQMDSMPAERVWEQRAAFVAAIAAEMARRRWPCRILHRPAAWVAVAAAVAWTARGR
jgi:hypothetical protein